MPLVVTDAIVLHSFDYLETSRVLRLITRESGLQSVLAKGARRTRGRVGSGMDLFAQGEAQIYVKPMRELNTLAAFDVTESRPGLALSLDRFAAASALSELTLRIAGEDANAELYDAVEAVLDAVSVAEPDDVATQALYGAWCVVAAAGFTPSLDRCAICESILDTSGEAVFSHTSGGLLCEQCRRSSMGVVARRLPGTAAARLRGWMRGEPGTGLAAADARAHQRLLREFVTEHLAGSDRPLRAYLSWERETAK